MDCVKSPKFLREQVGHAFNIPDMLLKGKSLAPFNQPLALGISGEGVQYAGQLPGLMP